MNAARPGSRHLQAMGIVQWQPRPAPKRTRMVQDPEQPVAWVVVEAELPLELSAGDAAGELLQNILKATGHAASAFAVCDAGRPPPRPPAGLPQIWFTRRPRPDSHKVLVLPALAEILTDPARKRLAWSRLEPWIPELTPR